MAFEQRPNSATLFKNKDKKEDKHPNLKGTGLLELDDGRVVELELAAWTKESDRAGKFLSLSIKLKRDRDSTESRAAGGREQFNQRVAQVGTPIDEPAQDEDQDIPFALPHDTDPNRRFPRA